MKIVGAVVAIAVWALLFKPIFDSTANFRKSVRFFFTPDLLSAIHGKGVEDFWAEVKLLIWLCAGFGIGYAVYAVIS